MQAGEPVPPQRDDRVAGVRADRENPHPLAVPDDRPPLGVARGCQRRLSELEVLRSIVVHDQQPIARRLDVVLNSLAAWRNDSWLTLGIVSTEQPEFEVILLPAPITIHRSSRLASTPSQKRSSGLGYHRNVWDGSVPRRCRKTTYGRQASSALV